MKKSEAVKAVAIMATIWPGRQVSEATTEQYAESLMDLEGPCLLAAVESLKTTSEFFPSIAALRREAMATVPGANIPDPDQAWTEVRREISRVGVKRGLEDWNTGKLWEPEFSHVAVKQAADAMGWDVLCTSENDEAARAHFMRFYGSSSSRAARETNMTPRGRQLVASLTSGIGRAIPEHSL